jgi:hypothetical protein
MNSRRLSEEKWLLEAEVQERIVEKNGRWEVSLIFIDVYDPNRLLIRVIGEYRSFGLAKICAQNMKRTAQKGSNNNQKISQNAYCINLN